MQWFVVDGKMPKRETVWLDLLHVGKKKKILYLTAVAIKFLYANQRASLKSLVFLFHQNYLLSKKNSKYAILKFPNKFN